ncbi:pilus assembly protein [Methylobacterium sp. C25]|uniref:TadE/TadG family type IV pilus assembly protein n=1 Tax=Methylobacterium sp. C25 TaxID=2721622 RepID=UPI001F1FFEE8|nr:pilus assembly protein [Methylobacterium sp. C25]MCE4222182.1 pilus assembly protein [Methylobacterium sp. C25]
MRRLLALSSCQLLRRFRRDARGNVATIFAATSIPIVTMAGVVIDYGANSSARQQLQNAVDATTLSLAKLPLSLTDQQLSDRANTQIKAAMTGSQVVNLTITTTRSDSNYTVTATGTTPTTLTKIVGFKTLPLNVTGTTKRGSGNLEIAMVLDNTGSMAGAKLTNLKSAATTMVNNLFAQVDPSKPNSLKIAIVPFSQTVNVGSSNISASWLDTAGLASYHSQLFASKVNRLALFAAMGVPWGGCVESRMMPYDVQDTTASATAPDTLYVPYFAPDESDNDSYASNDYLKDYSNSTNDRTRQASISKYTSNTWTVSKTSRNSSTTYLYGPNAGCDMQPITPLTTSQSTITTALSKLTVSGDTNIPMGLVWGWHNLSPTGPLVKGAAYSDQTTRKFIILMTDGENQSTLNYSNNGSYYSGISYIWADRLGNFNEYSSNASRTAALDSRLSTLCTNIKAAGIQIFTVRVEVTSGTSTLLQSCASSPSMFYDVSNSANLTAAFQAIGSQISELRLSN